MVSNTTSWISVSGSNWSSQWNFLRKLSIYSKVAGTATWLFTNFLQVIKLNGITEQKWWLLFYLPNLGQEFTAVWGSEPNRVQGKELGNLVFYWTAVGQVIYPVTTSVSSYVKTGIMKTVFQTSKVWIWWWMVQYQHGALDELWNTERFQKLLQWTE